MCKNINLNKAKKAKNDEFYTQYEDIEKEIIHYKEHLKDKIIYCNCDDPSWSNFWKYFKDNFNNLELKSLISTYYLGSITKDDAPIEQPIVYKTVYDGITETKTPLKGNGDFRSEECIDILKESDIVVTNPPFSLFREYVAQLIEYEKKFVVIGNMNAIKYKEIFPLIKEDKLWIGYNFVKKFKKPNGEIQTFGNIYWYTNLDIKKRHDEHILTKEYSEEEYPKYDNYEAINVNKVNDIPKDYSGTMGVPISFINKYNPSQFEILGELNNGSNNQYDYAKPKINNEFIYARILIKKKN